MRSLTFEECGMVAGGAIGAPMYTVYLGDSDDQGSQTGGQQNSTAQGQGTNGGRAPVQSQQQQINELQRQIARDQAIRRCQDEYVAAGATGGGLLGGAAAVGGAPWTGGATLGGIGGATFGGAAVGGFLGDMFGRVACENQVDRDLSGRR